MRLEERGETSPGRLADLAILGPLGEGGMGVVDRATQTALDREVAVKRLREQDLKSTRRQSLLREAMLTGRLQHPNIVPVHTLGNDDLRGPVVVMKHIRGSPWSDRLLADADRPLDERLETHLPVFMDVCQAIEFAHSQRVIHRDIKPENVMVGDFGEVVVLDWGVAVELDALSAEVVSDSIVGTPAYMAPELARGELAMVDARTDVYLLGGTLHELVTGRPPHRGPGIVEALYQAAEDVVAAPGPPCPPELSKIIARACERDRALRHPSVSDLAQAVRRFLRRRPLQRLLSGAQDALADLELLSGRRDDGDRAEDYQTALQRYGEVSFACRQAMEHWPADESAHGLSQRATEVMAEIEVGLRHVDAAEALITRLADPDQALLDAARRARDIREAEAAELSRRRQDDDLDVGRRQRFAFATLMLLMGVGIEVFRSVSGEHVQMSAETLFYLSVIAGGVLGGVLIVGRDRFMRTRVDRQMMLVGLVWVTFFMSHRLLAWQTGVDTSWIFTVDLLGLASSYALLMPFLRLARLNVAIALAGAVASTMWPAQGTSIFTWTIFPTVGLLLIDWGRRARAPEA